MAAFQQRAYADQFNARFFVEREAVLRRLRWQDLNGRSARGDRLPMWVLRQGQTIIGQLAISPVQVRWGNQWLRGGWCQDLIVAPEYRGRGAGVMLVREVLRTIATETAVALVGGTNRDSYPLFRAMGFQDVGVLPRYVGLMALTRLVSRGVADSDAVIQPCDGFDERFDGLWDARETSHTARVRRNQAWLQWRFSQHPHWRYSIWASWRHGHLTGYLIGRIGSTAVGRAALRTYRIVEVVADPFQAAALLARAVREGAERRCRLVRCDLLDASIGSRVLRRYGLWAIPSSNRVLVRVLDPASGFGVTRRQEWFLSAADSDFDLYEPRMSADEEGFSIGGSVLARTEETRV